MISTAIILAAGKGSRLQEVFSPKPLLPILPSKNIRFIDHHILGLIKLGVKKIIIVVGYKKDEIINYIKSKNYEEKYNIKIYFVENNEIDKYPKDGHSIYLGLKFLNQINENFTYLVCCDHYLDYSKLKNFINNKYDEIYSKLNNFSIIYFFTKNCNTMKPTQCAVGVFNENNKLIQCVKPKEEYLKENIALSIGFYIINVKKFYNYIQQFKDNDFDFQEKLNNIITEVYPIIIENFIWFGINTPQDYDNFKSNILKVFATPKCIVSRYINNPLAVPLIRYIINKKYISPNHLTMISFLFGIVSVIFVFLSIINYWLIIFSIIFYIIKCIFDTADGIIARIFQETTSIGHILDRIVDLSIDSLLFISFATLIFFKSGNFLLSLFILLLFSTFQSYYLISEFLSSEYGQRYKSFKVKENILLKLFKLLTPRDTQLIFIWLFTILSIWLPTSISIVIYSLWIICFIILIILKINVGFKLEKSK